MLSSISLFELAVKGGWLMLVLALLSVIAIYLFGKKWWVISQASKVDDSFMKDIRDYIHDGNVNAARDLCNKAGTPVAKMIGSALDRLGRSEADIRSAMDNVGNAETARMEKSLPYLAMISGGAPMIGFLGTVIGMVQAFFNMANAGNNIDITLLSGGIYTAMITTVGGLIVGILAYFGYNFLTSKVGDMAASMNDAQNDFMDILNESDKL